MLVTMNEILPAARREGRAVGAFNIGNYETALAVVRAAEELGQPVIVQLYSRLIDNGHGEPLGAAVRVLAEQASVPVALHLDHGSSVEQVRRAIAAGFTSVMLDASKLPFDENVAAVREAVKLAREAGVSIESEIGHVPMGGSTMAVSQLDETVRFYEETKVDALASRSGPRTASTKIRRRSTWISPGGSERRFQFRWCCTAVRGLRRRRSAR